MARLYIAAQCPRLEASESGLQDLRFHGGSRRARACLPLEPASGALRRSRHPTPSPTVRRFGYAPPPCRAGLALGDASPRPPPTSRWVQPAAREHGLRRSLCSRASRPHSRGQFDSDLSPLGSLRAAPRRFVWLGRATPSVRLPATRQTALAVSLALPAQVRDFSLGVVLAHPPDLYFHKTTHSRAFRAVLRKSRSSPTAFIAAKALLILAFSITIQTS